MMKSLDTGQVLRTWNSGSYKVGGTLEEMWTIYVKSGLRGILKCLYSSV